MDNIIAKFGLFYEKIKSYYKINDSATNRWNTIAKYMHDNNEIILKMYYWIMEQNDRTQINLDYKMTIDQIDEKISMESNDLVRTSLIVLFMHKSIYDLMSTEGNYFILLDGQEQMQVLDKKIMYYINVSIKKELNVNFHAYILLIALESLFNDKFYLGIDFEYTNKKIQLAQLNFEHNIDTKSMIMIISPNELESCMMDNFVNLIICSNKLKKILHGADALDLPYLYKSMLNDDTEKIIQATKTIIDTRFLCEYYKLSRDQSSDYRCSIYDQEPDRSAVYYFKVVSDEQQANLARVLDELPPHYDITWIISKLERSKVLYAQYDVLFLKYFYYTIIHMATLDEKTDIGKKSVITLYKHVLNEITRFVFLERYGATMLENKCKQEVDPINNYFIKKQSGIFKLIDIYNKILTGLETTHPMVKLDNLFKVNHFKKPVQNIIKRITYGFISKFCRVQKDKNTVWMDKLDNQFIFDFLENMEFKYLLSMFKDLSKTLETRIKDICRS